MISASARAQLLALRKRPAVVLITAAVAVLVVAFGYLLLYLLFGVLGDEQMTAGMDAAALITAMLPDNAGAMAVSMAGSYGGPAAVILGALAVGSEYGWRTHRLTTTQRPARAVVMGSTLIALAVVTLVIAGVLVIVTLLASLGIATAEGVLGAVRPSVLGLLGAVGAAWVVLTVWGLVGALLANLFRGTGIAIGVGLVYSFVYEGLIAGLPLDSRVLDVIRQALITHNAEALAAPLGDTTATVMAAAIEQPSPWRALAVLAGYAVVTAAVSCAVFARREVR